MKKPFHPENKKNLFSGSKYGQFYNYALITYSCYKYGNMICFVYYKYTFFVTAFCILYRFLNKPLQLAVKATYINFGTTYPLQNWKLCKSTVHPPTHLRRGLSLTGKVPPTPHSRSANSNLARTWRFVCLQLRHVILFQSSHLPFTAVND